MGWVIRRHVMEGWGRKRAREGDECKMVQGVGDKGKGGRER